MRLFIALIFAFAFGTSFFIKGSTASHDKDVKKEKEKEGIKKSLVEKLDPKSVEALKKILFQDVDKLRISGQKSARDCAEWLNRTERIVASLEKKIKTSKDEELVSLARELLKDVADFISLQSQGWKTREGSSRLSRLIDGDSPGIGYQIGWSSDGQWIVSQIRAKFTK